MKYLLVILVSLFAVSCSKSNDVADAEAKKVTYTIMIEAVDIDGTVTQSPANTIKL